MPAVSNTSVGYSNQLNFNKIMIPQSNPPPLLSIHTQPNISKTTGNPNTTSSKASKPSIKMCVGIQYIHAACYHAKRFDVVNPCNSVNGNNCNSLTTMHVVMITAPALCVGCFRQKEAAIDAEYETIRRELRREIERIDEFVANAFPLNEGGSGALGHYRTECKDNIVQAKASRDLSIRLFRQE